MAAKEIACLGHSITCSCTICGIESEGGQLISNGGFIQVEGKNVAVTGTIAQADCGHTGTVVGASQVLSIEGKQVARKGDSITGDIIGTIAEGFDFLKTE